MPRKKRDAMFNFVNKDDPNYRPNYGSTYNNLRVYFKPLYDGCETDGDFGSEAARDAFYHGNLASWNTISYQHAVLLKEQDEFKRMCDSIKTLLGTRQENGDSRLFFIQHKPGIGGTTLARQLAWELHKEYPVLEVHSYDSPGLVKQVETLYDSVVGKQPIILISDDTFPFVDSLCEDTLNDYHVIIERHLAYAGRRSIIVSA